ncbi:MAG TPA: hypothetical protein VK475_02615, partial [Pyrinomonadaceae bacterium]|nr:hypothetical protein [Pyrinomonadaceae bacterium]
MNPLKKTPYVIGLLFILAIAALTFPFSGGAAPGAQDKSAGAPSQTRDLPNYDAFGASTKRSAAAQANAQSGDQTRYEGGHLVQSEPRLGVPTFLWASPQTGPARSLLTSGQTLSGNEIETAAREHLGRYASQYRLSERDVTSARLAGIHDTGKGAIIVKFKQDIGGVEVFRDEINVIMDRQYQLVALSGYLTGESDGVGLAAQSFNLQPNDALAKVLGDLTGSEVSAAGVHSVQASSSEANPYLLMTADKTGNFSFAGEPARVKKVFYHLVDEYVPAYYVEADISVPSTSGNVLSVDGGMTREEKSYSYVISATDGQILFRNNLIANESQGKKGAQESSLAPGGFTYRVWADPVTGLPYDTPAGNLV